MSDKVLFEGLFKGDMNLEIFQIFSKLFHLIHGRYVLKVEPFTIKIIISSV